MCSKTYENNDVKKTIVDTKFNMENDDSDDETVDASLMSSELFCGMSKMSSLDFLLLLFSLSSICCIHILLLLREIQKDFKIKTLHKIWINI